MQTIAEFLAHIRNAYGERPAAIEEAGRLSYEELDLRSGDIARGLLARGAGKGTRIAIVAPNGADFLLFLFAALRIGAITIPISTLSAPEELRKILQHSDSQVLLAVRRYAGRDYGKLVADAVPAVTQGIAGELRADDAPYLRSVCFDDARELGWARPIDDLISAARQAPGLAPAFLAAIERRVDATDWGVIIYTSGSTAEPKAVIHSQRTMVRQAHALADLHALAPGERVLPMLPLFWVGGLGIALETLAVGGCLLFPDGPSAESVADTIRRHGADRLHSWPALRQRVRDILTGNGIDVAAIRGLGPPKDDRGSIIDADRVSGSLGMTESFGPHSGCRVDRPLPADRAGSFGHRIGTIEHRVFDPETLEEVPAGAQGELWLRGGHLMEGIYRKPRLETFTPDGFYRTQDLVRIEEDGHLFFVGRLGDMIKARGANVSRLEVEQALRSLSGVEEAFVCGLADEAQGESIAALVVAKPGAQASEEEIQAALASKLSRYKIPSHIVFVGREDLSWTPSGKIMMERARRLLLERLGRSSG